MVKEIILFIPSFAIALALSSTPANATTQSCVELLMRAPVYYFGPEGSPVPDTKYNPDHTHCPFPYCLSPDWKAAIQRHSLRELEDLNDVDTVFVVSWTYSNVPEGSIGESAQSWFVRKILQEAFPRATFLNPNQEHDRRKELQGKRIIRLRARDWSGEQRQVPPPLSATNTEISLDMPFLKRANPSYSDLDRSELREAFGISEGEKVASVYAKHLGHRDSAGEGLKDFAKRLVAHGFRKFFFTAAYGSQENLQLGDEFDLTVASQWIRGARISGNRPLFIINDFLGHTSLFHKAADLVLVEGPVNPFEGLFQGTPTVIFNNERTLGNYGKEAYESMLRRAVSTNRAVSIDRIGLFDDAILRISELQSASFISPDLIPAGIGADALSARQALLDHLVEQIREAIAFMKK